MKVRQIPGEVRLVSAGFLQPGLKSRIMFGHSGFDDAVKTLTRVRELRIANRLTHDTR
jgi:hypothetical protein